MPAGIYNDGNCASIAYSTFRAPRPDPQRFFYKTRLGFGFSIIHGSEYWRYVPMRNGHFDQNVTRKASCITRGRSAVCSVANVGLTTLISGGKNFT